MLGVVTQCLAEITVLAEKGGVPRAAFLEFLNDSVMGSTGGSAVIGSGSRAASVAGSSNGVSGSGFARLSSAAALAANSASTSASVSVV